MNDGGNAFPIPETEWNNIVFGMSLRDYFAAAALQTCSIDPLHISSVGRAVKEATEMCYMIADAMLAAREPKPE